MSTVLILMTCAIALLSTLIPDVRKNSKRARWLLFFLIMCSTTGQIYEEWATERDSEHALEESAKQEKQRDQKLANAADERARLLSEQINRLNGENAELIEKFGQSQIQLSIQDMEASRREADLQREISGLESKIGNLRRTVDSLDTSNQFRHQQSKSVIDRIAEQQKLWQINQVDRLVRASNVIGEIAASHEIASQCRAPVQAIAASVLQLDQDGGVQLLIGLRDGLQGQARPLAPALNLQSP